MTIRRIVVQHDMDQGLKELHLALHRQFMLKGRGAFVSSHEALGVITEEFAELTLAVQSNDNEQIRKELMDMAVAAIFAYVCAEEDGV